MDAKNLRAVVPGAFSSVDSAMKAQNRFDLEQVVKWLDAMQNDEISWRPYGLARRLEQALEEKHEHTGRAATNGRE